MQEIEKANTALIEVITQLKNKLGSLLPPSLFTCISKKLGSTSNDAANIVELIHTISKTNTPCKATNATTSETPAPATALDVVEDYIAMLESYYQEVVVVLEDTITKKTNESLLPLFVKKPGEVGTAQAPGQSETQASMAAGNTKAGAAKQLFATIQAMKIITDNYPSKPAQECLRSLLNEEHKLQMGLIILLALTFSVYWAKSPYVPKVWPKNMRELHDILTRDLPAFNNLHTSAVSDPPSAAVRRRDEGNDLAIGMKHLETIFGQVLTPLLSTKIAEVKTAFQLDVVVEYYFVAASMIDLQKPTNAERAQPALVGICCKSCAPEMLFRMGVMLLCHSVHPQSKLYFADLLSNFLLLKNGLKTVMLTLVAAQWPPERAAHALCKIVCSIPQGMDKHVYFANVTNQLFNILLMKDLRSGELDKTELTFTILKNIVLTQPEVADTLIMQRLFEKAYEIALVDCKTKHSLVFGQPLAGESDLLTTSINITSFAKDLGVAVKLLHRFDIVPAICIRSIHDCLHGVLTAYSLGMLCSNNRLFLAELKGQVEELLTTICAAKGGDVNVLADDFVRFFLLHLQRYNEMLAQYREALKSGSQKTHEPTVIYPHYSESGNIIVFSERSIKDALEEHFAKKTMKDVYEGNAAVLSLLIKGCIQDKLANMKLIARRVFLALLQELEQLMNGHAENQSPGQGHVQVQVQVEGHGASRACVAEIEARTKELLAEAEGSALLCPAAEFERLRHNVDVYSNVAVILIHHLLTQFAEHYDQILEQVDDYLAFIKSMLSTDNASLLQLSLMIIHIALEQKLPLTPASKLHIIEMYPLISQLANSCPEAEVRVLATSVVELLVEADLASKPKSDTKPNAETQKRTDYSSLLEQLKAPEPYVKAMGLETLSNYLRQYRPLEAEEVNQLFILLRQQIRSDDTYILTHSLNAMTVLGDIYTEQCLALLTHELQSHDPLSSTLLISELKETAEKAEEGSEEEKAPDPLTVLYKTKIAEALCKVAKAKGRMFHSYPACGSLLDVLLKAIDGPKSGKELVASYLTVIAEVCKGFEELPATLHLVPIVRTALNLGRIKDNELRKACFVIIRSIVKVWPQTEVNVWTKEISLFVQQAEVENDDPVLRSYCSSIKEAIWLLFPQSLRQFVYPNPFG